MSQQQATTSTTKKNEGENPNPKSALDVAVNQLVRASVGGDIPSSLEGEDLDKYVADLLLKEAANKNKLYKEEGVRALLPNTGLPPCPLPKTNKRFLFNIVRNVNNHNKAVIKRTEEKAAAALRRTIRIPSWSDDDKSYHKRKRREEGITIDTTAEVLRGGGEGVEAAIVEIEEKVMMIVEIGITIVIEEVL
nr:13012_t:CDS:2 [Entrophospora candida]